MLGVEHDDRQCPNEYSHDAAGYRCRTSLGIQNPINNGHMIHDENIIAAPQSWGETHSPRGHGPQVRPGSSLSSHSSRVASATIGICVLIISHNASQGVHCSASGG